MRITASITLVLVPNDHSIGWVYPVRHERPGALLRRIKAGGWPFPAAWRARLEQAFSVPPDLHLRTSRHGQVLLVFPEPPLVERSPLPPAPVHLSPLQRQVMALLSQGLTADQISLRTHYHRRWIRYQVSEVVRKIK